MVRSMAREKTRNIRRARKRVFEYGRTAEQNSTEKSMHTHFRI